MNFCYHSININTVEKVKTFKKVRFLNQILREITPWNSSRFEEIKIRREIQTFNNVRLVLSWNKKWIFIPRKPNSKSIWFSYAHNLDTLFKNLLNISHPWHFSLQGSYTTRVHRDKTCVREKMNRSDVTNDCTLLHKACVIRKAGSEYDKAGRQGRRKRKNDVLSKNNAISKQ